MGSRQKKVERIDVHSEEFKLLELDLEDARETEAHLVPRVADAACAAAEFAEKCGTTAASMEHARRLQSEFDDLTGQLVRTRAYLEELDLKYRMAVLGY